MLVWVVPSYKVPFCKHLWYQVFTWLLLGDYSRARLIRMANARKNHVNYPSMRIIRAYFTLCFYQWQGVVSRASVRITQGMRISEGQIIQAILYMVSAMFGFICKIATTDHAKQCRLSPVLLELVPSVTCEYFGTPLSAWVPSLLHGEGSDLTITLLKFT